jgi:hypothetical protein
VIHRLMVMHPHTKYWPIFDLFLKKQLFDLEVKVQRRSLRYATHRLMVMHPHTKYPWPISKETIIWPWGQRSLQYATHRLMVMHPHTNYHWPTSKDKNVMARTRKYYLKTIIWPWGQRSRSHEGHYGTRHTALWSCTHMRNIIDLSRKTKKLWSGQASLRRSGSGRKNQTKTICLPSFEGET